MTESIRLWTGTGSKPHSCRTVSYCKLLTCYRSVDDVVGKTYIWLSAYDIVQSRFAFLSHLDTLTTDEIRNAASHLVLTYPADWDPCMENKIIQFADLSKSFAHEQTDETSKELFLYRLIATKGLKDTFPKC